MSGAINAKELGYIIDEDDAVWLCAGPIRVKVCESFNDFDDFMNDAVEQLRGIAAAIAAEIAGNFGESEQ